MSAQGQKRHFESWPVTSGPHSMQGWTSDFIPQLTDDAVAMKVIDRILPISGPDAIRSSKDLATQEASSSALPLVGPSPAR
jgi:cysteine synthase